MRLVLNWGKWVSPLYKCIYKSLGVSCLEEKVMTLDKATLISPEQISKRQYSHTLEE